MALHSTPLHWSASQANPTALSSPLEWNDPHLTSPRRPRPVKTLPTPVKPHQFQILLLLLHKSRSNSPASLHLDWVGFRAAAASSMNPNGHLSTCPKHPTQPPFTGFCSACLLERLSAAHLPSASSSPAAAAAAASEITTETDPNPRPTRTTLLYLFQLDDMADGSTSAADHLGVHIHTDQQQDPPSLPQAGGGGGPPLQRKRSLRQSCDWIVCCDNGSDSWLPSRQSWDGSAPPPPPSANAAAAQLVLDRRTTNKAPLSWNQVWDRRVAKPLRGFVSKPARALLLKRSLSESEGPQAAGVVGIRINGSHSTGMDSEISQCEPDSIHAHVHNVRRDSLTKRLYWLGRSRSVHYSSPPALDTGMLRFHLTPLSSSNSSSSSSSMANKTQGRRLSLFAAQKHHQ